MDSHVVMTFALLSACRKVETTVRIMYLYKLSLVKICNGGFILDSSQFSLLPHLAPALKNDATLASKVVKIDLKIENSHFTWLV